jgi:hypothetical protein
MSEKKDDKDRVEVIRGWAQDIARLERLQAYLAEPAKSRAAATIANLKKQIAAADHEIKQYRLMGYKV